MGIESFRSCVGFKGCVLLRVMCYPIAVLANTLQNTLVRVVQQNAMAGLLSHNL